MRTNRYIAGMNLYQTVDDTDETVLRDGTIKLHGPAAFEGMRRAGRLADACEAERDVPAALRRSARCSMNSE